MVTTRSGSAGLPPPGEGNSGQDSPRWGRMSQADDEAGDTPLLSLI